MFRCNDDQIGYCQTKPRLTYTRLKEGRLDNPKEVLALDSECSCTLLSQRIGKPTVGWTTFSHWDDGDLVITFEVEGVKTVHTVPMDKFDFYIDGDTQLCVVKSPKTINRVKK